jgi:hypothetical protein
METEILTINDLSDYLKIKRSSIYGRVEKKRSHTTQKNCCKNKISGLNSPFGRPERVGKESEYYVV